ncbi:hypothetical protein AAFF_G00330850 [Aldrovandia affinis]|uniref:Uncharacterized protein n=1 Tax=Aldrovandia affinis TaxID=143900 RepID=A0AAD7R6J7_9TELE|nr:hypothetical protein AAFF_G00330850 [Aldrovandia affinis]
MFLEVVVRSGGGGWLGCPLIVPFVMLCTTPSLCQRPDGMQHCGHCLLHLLSANAADCLLEMDFQEE